MLQHTLMQTQHKYNRKTWTIRFIIVLIVIIRVIFVIYVVVIIWAVQHPITFSVGFLFYNRFHVFISRIFFLVVYPSTIFTFIFAFCLFLLGFCFFFCRFLFLFCVCAFFIFFYCFFFLHSFETPLLLCCVQFCFWVTVLKNTQLHTHKQTYAYAEYKRHMHTLTKHINSCIILFLFFFNQNNDGLAKVCFFYDWNAFRSLKHTIVIAIVIFIFLPQYMSYQLLIEVQALA